ncbi:heterodisulfide reductase-related iron-sulfur binding cluster [Brevibacillus sp. B_LB10_24]|uniref:heterodisulfide reductase-related iron-sulfur binding cluster n=1 Tax=Brevibacillus sp. B_LB10_24 TaxID=3380645 RepID=UPI0038B6B4DC
MLALFNFLAFLIVTGYAVYSFAQLVYSRYLFVKLGKKAAIERNLKERLYAVLVNVFGQKKLFKDKKSGWMHLILFYGFIIIQIGLIEIIVKGFRIGFEFPIGESHKYFSFLQEWTTFLMLLAVIYGFYRRYIEKLKRLQLKRDAKAAFVYIALATLTLSILLVLGFETVMLGHEPDLVHAPFSGVIALLLGGIGTAAGSVLFYVFWWVHLLTVLSFLVFVPQSKQAHELFAAFNVFFKKTGPVGKLKKIDFEEEEAEEYGVGKIEGFTQQQLIDLYACVECGRCTNMCPATGTGKTQKIVQSFSKIMNVAGIRFAILGNEEGNSGDMARRMGNEFLFQQLCQENIANFEAYGVKKIVTIDPHAYNTFKHEYPEFGLQAEVYHHTELLWKWIQEGRIKPQKEVKEAVAYHDSCYLGRYNSIYDIPRLILSSIPGVAILEMERKWEDSMCCGAGGGRMWMEETQGKRINIARTEQALLLNPTLIGSNCPYCLTMLTDGTKATEVEEQVKTMDIVEIVEIVERSLAG